MFSLKFLKNIKYNTIALGTVFIVANVLLWGLLFYEGIGRIQTTYGSIQENSQKITELDQRREYYSNIDKAFTQESSAFTAIENTILDLQNPLPFIELIETLGREQKLETKLSVLDLKEDDEGKIQFFELKAEGAYPDVMHFFEIVEYIPYQISMSDIYFDFTPISVDPKKTSKNEKVKYVTRMVVHFGIRAK